MDIQNSLRAMKRTRIYLCAGKYLNGSSGRTFYTIVTFIPHVLSI